MQAYDIMIQIYTEYVHILPMIYLSEDYIKYITCQI